MKLTVYIRIREEKSSVQIIQQFRLHVVLVYQTNGLQKTAHLKRVYRTYPINYPILRTEGR
jgi:hypothetical protein